MARPILRTRSRRRGGTFTIIVLGATMLLMVSASVYVEATRLGFERQALYAHRCQAREAAFAATRWAVADADAGGKQSGQGVLEFAGPVQVRVVYEANGEHLKVTASARCREVLEVLRGRLERRDGRWRLVSYEF